MKLIELFKNNMERKELVDFINKFAQDYFSVQTIAEIYYPGFKRYSFYEIKRALLLTMVRTNVIIEDMGETTRGYYSHSENLIALNPKTFNAGTIAHEMTHGIQFNLGYNFDGYVRYLAEKDNYDDYRYQHVEYEAFRMGDRWGMYVSALRRYIKKQIKKGLAI